MPIRQIKDSEQSRTAQDKPAKKVQKFLPRPPAQAAGVAGRPTELPSGIEPTARTTPSADVKTLLSWSAPGRPFRKRGKQYYLTAILIVLLVEIILFLFSQYLLMLVVLSLLFVTFALATVPPKNFHYRISTQGLTVEDHMYLWQELYDFYFKRRGDLDILHVRTKTLFPGEITITLGEVDREHVRTVLIPYLPYREMVKLTFMEKSGDWLAKNFPLEGKPS